MNLTMFALVVLACASIPTCLFLLNFRSFRAPSAAGAKGFLKVAVLIPARNEETNIGDALWCVLASRGVEIEVLIYDDASTDRTPSIVREFANRDRRVRLISGATLPGGWNGKQHACWQLAQASTAPLLLFLDADLRLEPDALLSCAAQRQTSGVALLSGFPRLITETWMEWLLLPLIQFVLLGLLPISRMRKTTLPAYAAGCGQFMLAEREAYFASGGHAAIRETRHDGLRLPKLFRQHKLRTDICDLTRLARVRMYCSASGVWNGLAKNATEGLGSPGKILPFTAFLLLGQVVPALAAIMFFVFGLPLAVVLGSMGMDVHVTPNLQSRSLLAMFAVALLGNYLPRILSFRRFQQPLRSALLHPFGVLLLIVIQWYALARQIVGKPIGWRARLYSSNAS